MPRTLPLLPAILVALVTISCAGTVSLPQPSVTKDPLTGVYIARGGGGALDNVLPLIKAFGKVHPNVTWQGLDDIGSDAGVKLVQSGDIDLAFISRELRPAEVGTVNTLPIGATGTGIAVGAANPVTGLARDQLAKVFTGEIATWSSIGGDVQPIRVVLREAGSATRNAFEALCFGAKAPQGGYAKNAIEVGSYDETVKAMKSVSGAIGMMSMSAAAFAEPSIKLLAIDGVAATRESLLSGRYPMRRPLYFVWSTDPKEVPSAVLAFIEFVKGPEGRAILNSL